MKRTHSAARLLVATLFALSALGWAQQSGDEFHWTGKLAAEQVVEIKNVNGAIDVTGATGDQVEVTAIRSGPDKDQVHVEAVKGPEGMIFCAVYPGGTCAAGSSSHSYVHDVHAKVDFDVRIPRNLRLTATNVNGRVQADGIGRYVKASSVNGAVDVSTDAWAEVSSVNGSIHARMGRGDWPGTLKISTVNGGINLDMPASLNSDVNFSSVNGRLSSDFPVTMSSANGLRWGPKSMHGRIGNGGRELDVSSVNGSVEIRRGGAGL